jgi:hypothetical protein
MTSGRRQLLAALALAGVCVDARSLVCRRLPSEPPWPGTLLAQASAVFVGWVVDVEGDQQDRLAFAIGRVMVERGFRGALTGQVRLVLPAFVQPGQRLLVFAHRLSELERVRLVTRRLDLQRYQQVDCSLFDEGHCSAGRPRPDIDFPALGAVDLRACQDPQVLRLVPGSRDPREQEEPLLGQLEAALQRVESPR